MKERTVIAMIIRGACGVFFIVKVEDCGCRESIRASGLRGVSKAVDFNTNGYDYVIQVRADC